MSNKPRASGDERIVSSASPRKGAQIITGSQSVGAANQKGAGIIVDGQMIALQADIVNLMSRSVVTISDAPLNEVARGELYSAEVTDILKRDIVAGQVIWGIPVPHTHMYGAIKIPSTYRSRYINKIRELKSVITRMTPLLLAVGLSGLAGLELPDIFDVEVAPLDKNPIASGTTLEEINQIHEDIRDSMTPEAIAQNVKDIQSRYKEPLVLEAGIAE